MNKLELEKRLSDEGLFTVYDRGAKKQYIDGEKLIETGTFKNTINVFGFYKSVITSEYKFFITDAERGIPYYSDFFATEQEACEGLYKKIARLKRIHDKTKD
jgi:hypothetical protein